MWKNRNVRSFVHFNIDKYRLFSSLSTHNLIFLTSWNNSLHCNNALLYQDGIIAFWCCLHSLIKFNVSSRKFAMKGKSTTAWPLYSYLLQWQKLLGKVCHDNWPVQITKMKSIDFDVVVNPITVSVVKLLLV